MNKEDILLDAQGIIKTFLGVQALKGVDLQILRGEVHALIGENGAGKSTLIKVLTGAIPKDEGCIRFCGKEVNIQNRIDAQNLGIAVIFQELSLIPTLTVAQNVLLCREPVNRIGIINQKKLLNKVRALINKFELPLDENAIIENLSISQRQLVGILGALSLNASLIIMDEPTTSLTTSEVDHLFKIIKELCNKNVSVLFISHRIKEIYDLADSITILRDGEKVGSFKKNEIKPEMAIKLMIGKDVKERTFNYSSSIMLQKPILQVRRLTQNNVFSEISFDVYPGEVVGLAGLIGSGRTEILKAIFGADKINRGEILLEQKKVKIDSIRKAIRLGIGLIPEDRRIQGLVPLLSITKNIGLCNFDQINRYRFFVNSKLENQISQNAITKFDIRPKNPNAAVCTLSGGNQQKVVVGKWLIRNLKILLIDEPTAGVDVGAKDEIHRLLKELLKQGVGVVMVSSDLSELILLSHRIIVLRSGIIVKEFKNQLITEEEILAASSGIDYKVVE